MNWAFSEMHGHKHKQLYTRKINDIHYNYSMYEQNSNSYQVYFLLALMVSNVQLSLIIKKNFTAVWVTTINCRVE